MKAFNYYYWFAYPCPSEPHFENIDQSKAITDIFSEIKLKALNDAYFSLPNDQRIFFIIKTTEDNNHIDVEKLSAVISATEIERNFVDANLDEIYFCFSDSSAHNEYPGWPLRLFLLALTHLW